MAETESTKRSRSQRGLRIMLRVTTGIRKVIGASESNIVLMLCGEFMRPVIIANVVAWPLGWWIMDRWLEDFAFRVAVGPMPFVLSGVISIAVLTIGFQAARAAKQDLI